jgi:hypothetical protein
VLDMVRQRANPGDVERLLLDTAIQDGKRARIGFGQEIRSKPVRTRPFTSYARSAATP